MDSLKTHPRYESCQTYKLRHEINVSYLMQWDQICVDCPCKKPVYHYDLVYSPYVLLLQSNRQLHFRLALYTSYATKNPLV